MKLGKMTKYAVLALGVAYAANFVREGYHFASLHAQANIFNDAAIRQRLDNKPHEKTDALAAIRHYESLHCMDSAFFPWLALESPTMSSQDAQTFAENNVSPRYHAIETHPCQGPQCPPRIVITPGMRQKRSAESSNQYENKTLSAPIE